MLSHEICEIFKNTYFEEHLRKIASVCFTSKYYNKLWCEFELDETSTGCNVSIFLNVTILFNQMQPYNLYESFFDISEHL